MGQTRLQLRNEVRRNLGHPFVKVELCDQHIDDAINKARDMWIKWAVGNATHEVWFTMMLKEGSWIYDLPMGVIEVVDYKDYQGHTGGSDHTYDKHGGPQQLFSLDNAMYMNGFMNGNMGGGMWGGRGGFDLVGLEIAHQYMGTLEHYEYNEYDWTYHRHTNQLELRPNVPCKGRELTITTDDTGDWRVYDNITCSAAPTGETTFSSPGFVLLRTYMIEGASLPTYVPPTSGDIQNSIFDIADSYLDWMYSEVWIKEYVTALSMITLGRVRRKFSNFSSLGNQGIAMDGSDLISEGTTEKDRLEEELDLKHAYEGYGIVLG